LWVASAEIRRPCSSSSSRKLRLRRVVVVEYRLAVDVVLAGPPADAEFDGVDADIVEVRDRVVDRFAA